MFPWMEEGIEVRIDLGANDPSWGPVAIPLHPRSMEKLASSSHTPDKLLDFMDRIRPRDDGRYVLLNAIGSYEFWSCFPAGTRILLGDGSEIPIEEILPGDTVITHKNRPRKVLRISQGRNNRGLVKVSLTSCVRSVRATRTHPFLVIPRDIWVRARQPIMTKRKKCGLSYKGAMWKFLKSLKPVWIEAAELQHGDRVLMPIERRTEETPEVKDFARMFGYYVAEGCTAASRKHYKPTDKRYVFPDRQMVFVTAQDESWIHKDLVEAGERLERITQTRMIVKSSQLTANPAGVCRQNLMHSEMTKFAVEHFGKYADGKFISPKMLKMPVEWQLEFLGAYLDGDGCQVASETPRIDGLITANSASMDLIIGLQKMMWRLGIRASTFAGTQRCQISYGNPIYDLDVPKAQASALRGHTHFDSHEDPENTTAMIVLDDQFAYVPVRSVEEEEFDGLVYNLEVEEDNSYVAEGIAVHNSNANADAFPEWSLKGDPIPEPIKQFCRERSLAIPTDWGYTTFERYAYVYRHHQNKDPIHSIGERVCCAAYNEQMHRIELIVFILTSKAPDIVQRIDEGVPVPWSMGSRLPFDICSVCLKVSTKVEDYCEHLKTMKNQILPNGEKVFSWNYFPRFFDISAVVVPADRSAYSLKKVASMNRYLGSDFVQEGALVVPAGMSKYASMFDYLSTGGSKMGEIEKEVPAQEPAKDLGESPINPDVWRMLFERVINDRERTETMPAEMESLKGQSQQDILSALTSLGVILKPEESAEMLDRPVPQDLDLQPPSNTLLGGIKGLVSKRSLFEPAFSGRDLSKMSKPGSTTGRVLVKQSSAAVHASYMTWLKHLDFDRLEEVVSRPSVQLVLDPGIVEAKIIGLEKVGRRSFPESVRPFIAGVSIG